MEFMKKIHYITLKKFPTKLEKIKIETIWSWAFIPVTVPNCFLHFFTRERRRQQ
jgi:tRNA U34 5-methylaminomethyl-2-thiouridine-forming methyltransferase MnmC